MSIFHREEAFGYLASTTGGGGGAFSTMDLDFIGEFKDFSNSGHKWILTATDYFTIWVESIPTKKSTEKVVMDFIEKKIIIKFGVPTKITTNNDKYFSSAELATFYFNYGTILFVSSNYFLWCNGLVESSNKNLMKTIKKVMGDNKSNSDGKIKYALWENIISKKQVIVKSPF